MGRRRLLLSLFFLAIPVWVSAEDSAGDYKCNIQLNYNRCPGAISNCHKTAPYDSAHFESRGAASKSCDLKTKSEIERRPCTSENKPCKDCHLFQAIGQLYKVEEGSADSWKSDHPYAAFKCQREGSTDTNPPEGSGESGDGGESSGCMCHITKIGAKTVSIDMPANVRQRSCPVSCQAHFAHSTSDCNPVGTTFSGTYDFDGKSGPFGGTCRPE